MRSYTCIFLFVCALALALVAQTSPGRADKRVALVVGNGNYAHTPALENPRNDAADVAQALTALGFEVTLKLDVDKRQMDQIVAQFARAAKGSDAALFYYAGHGMQFEGKNYLMAVDATLQDEVSTRYEMTAIDDIKAALQFSPGVKIMVLDACRDNPLADLFVRSISMSTRGAPPKVQGYARPEKSQGMIIVYATQADEVALDGGGRNSPFTRAFLKEIKEPGLEIGAMFRRISSDVYAATNGLQSPELSISMVPEYYLNQAETDQTIWARIRSQADMGTLREFIDRYPNSFYAPDARARLDLLEREAREKADQEAAERQRERIDAEAARLREEQTQRERAAAEAREHERDLAAKLAATEALRQTLAQELADQAASQAAAEARDRAELEQAQKERAQREADLRAQIDREQATASQLEKERLLREALEKDRDQRQAAEEERADRERAANDEKARETQVEGERAQALKAEIAELEQQALQAKASAEAEIQNVEDAKKASAAADAKKAASVAPAAPPGLTIEQRGLVSPIEAELRRVGCYVGADGNWDSAPIRLGVAKFVRYAKLSMTPTAPDDVLLDSLKNAHDRVCPPECTVREVAVNGQCVAKGCPQGELLSRDGGCYPRPAPPRPASTVRAVAAVHAVAAARERVRRPAPPTSHCFNFNGNQYCE